MVRRVALALGGCGGAIGGERVLYSLEFRDVELRGRAVLLREEAWWVASGRIGV
jgi:hypothetical protein